MELRLAPSIAGVAALFALAPALGQSQASAIYEPPRTPDGHPDLQGIWQVVNTAAWDLEDHGASLGVPAGQSVVEGGAIPYLPEALAKRQENYLHRATRDPETRCYLPGVPRITYMPYPFQIIQQADRVTIAYEYLRAVRFIYMNGNPHPPGPIEWWMGDSRGRWDGDTLVVDVVHFNDQTWFDRAGNFHSAALHVVERYTPIGPDHLLYEATMEDPNVFSRPWTISMPLYRRQEPHAELLEYQCPAYLLEQEWDNPESSFFEEH
ncbi:MAG TPA: hypothetical protein VIV14_03180 [Gammaproteobacteria bacterium]